MGSSTTKFKRNIFWSSVWLLFTTVLLVGCGGTTPSGNQTPAPQSITFWSAPNPTQQGFWTEMAKAYMSQHKGVQITVRAMPESPSSEAAIQAALAGGTAPTASENIFTGFAGQLVNSQALVPLDQMPGWNDLITSRHMDQTIQGWKFSDNHTYVLPIYTNAILVSWRMDILKQIGYDKPPTTYSEILQMGDKLKQKFPDKFVWARDALAKDTWWERWFDFFTLYDAASNGKSLINGTQVSADDQSAVGTLSFFKDLNQKKLLLTQPATDPFENGVSVMSIIGPWQFSYWQQKYPTLKLNDNYVLTSPPVPDNYPAGQAVKTFADAKGVVIYKQGSAEQQQAMWDFIKWTFSDPQHDLKWLQTTSLPSARDDLGTNAAFKPFFDQHQELTIFAQNIANSIPPLKNAKFTDIQTALGTDAIIPVIKGQATPDQAWNSWKAAVQPMLS